MINLIKKHQALFLSALFVWLLAPWFSPAPTSADFLQVDFWLLWFFAMIFLALPYTFLEVALAKRSKKTSMAALPELTRQADAKTHWRIAGWLGIFALIVMASGWINASATHFSQFVLLDGQANLWLWLGIISVLMIGVSFVSYWMLPIAMLMAFIAVVISGVNVSANWQITGLSFVEWKRAVLLALVCTGMGTGLYWQSSLSKEKQSRATLLVVLPIWFMQLLAGILFALFQGVHGDDALWLYHIAVILTGAVMLALAKENLSQTPKGLVIAGVGLVVSVLLWQVIPKAWLIQLLALLMLVTCLIYAIFAGWQMKISHLRKSLKFDSEAVYNLWRVFIRIVIPLSIITAMIGSVVSLF